MYESRVCSASLRVLALCLALVAAACGSDTAVTHGIPELDFDPRELRFGNVDVGGSLTDSFIIENRGTAILEIRGLQVIEGSGLIYQVSIASLDSYQDFNIDPGKAVEVEVTFAPRDARDYLSYVLFNTNDSNEQQGIVELTGRGEGQQATPTDDHQTPPASPTPTEEPLTPTVTPPHPTPTQPPATATQAPTPSAGSR